ncbi:hypothetical protein CRUP_019842 [Coryphaenoides rupestris]|nr:hypothetical protein CRUP_019842 [Coryphaenoides rupestris]
MELQERCRKCRGRRKETSIAPGSQIDLNAFKNKRF